MTQVACLSFLLAKEIRNLGREPASLYTSFYNMSRMAHGWVLRWISCGFPGQWVGQSTEPVNGVGDH